MKRIAFIVAVLVAFAVDVKAQIFSTLETQTLAVVPAEDTLTNTDTAHLVSKTVSLYSDLEFKLTVTKISGTVAGEALLQGWNGSQWVTLASDVGAAIASQYVEDTATITNATASYYWKLPAAKATYSKYQIRDISSGTNVHTPTGVMYIYNRAYIKP